MFTQTRGLATTRQLARTSEFLRVYTAPRMFEASVEICDFEGLTLAYMMPPEEGKTGHVQSPPSESNYNYRPSQPGST